MTDNRGMPIRLLTPEAAAQRHRAGALLVDVRADHERALGMAAGALGVVREVLEADPHRHLSHPSREVVLICQSVVRSQLAAEALRDRGFTHLSSVEGGTEAWAAAGLPVVSAAAAPRLSIFRQVQIAVGLLVVIGVLAGFAFYAGVGHGASQGFGQVRQIAARGEGELRRKA